jgi:hypothetical protein
MGMTFINLAVMFPLLLVTVLAPFWTKSAPARLIVPAPIAVRAVFKVRFPIKPKSVLAARVSGPVPADTVPLTVT